MVEDGDMYLTREERKKEFKKGLPPEFFCNGCYEFKGWKHWARAKKDKAITIDFCTSCMPPIKTQKKVTKKVKVWM